MREPGFDTVKGSRIGIQILKFIVWESFTQNSFVAEAKVGEEKN